MNATLADYFWCLKNILSNVGFYKGSYITGSVVVVYRRKVSRGSGYDS